MLEVTTTHLSDRHSKEGHYPMCLSLRHRHTLNTNQSRNTHLLASSRSFQHPYRLETIFLSFSSSSSSWKRFKQISMIQVTRRQVGWLSREKRNQFLEESRTSRHSKCNTIIIIIPLMLRAALPLKIPASSVISVLCLHALWINQ